MATSITVMSWNVQILGETKVKQYLVVELLARVVALYNPDIVIIQELVYAAEAEVRAPLVKALATYTKANWAGTAVQALPGGRDRDGYLFLWRDTVKQQQIAGTGVQGNFGGDWPSNISAKHGRIPGYCGFTLADGSHPFLVAGYHAPTYATASLGSAPATALVALKTRANDLLNYPGTATAYEARFFCADFNMPFTADTKTNFYGPAMTATSTENAISGATSAGNTIMVPIDKAPKSDKSTDYYQQNLDNVLAGPTGRMTGVMVVDTINIVQTDKICAQLAESALFSNESKTSWGKGTTAAAFVAARTFLSDHLPVLVKFTLVP